MSRLRRGPGSGGARPPRRGEAVGGWGGGAASPRPRLSPATFSFLKHFCERLAGAEQARREPRTPGWGRGGTRHCRCGVSLCRRPRRGRAGRDALCSARAAVSGPAGAGGTRRHKGSGAARTQKPGGEKEKCGKSTRCPLLLILHLLSSGRGGGVG